MSKQFFEDVRKELESMDKRSAWKRGVNDYAHGFVDDLIEFMDYGDITLEEVQGADNLALQKILLNGADNWHHYSWAGCSLCYDGQIAERLATPSQLKRTHDGNIQPRAGVHWLDLQAQALASAYWRVYVAINRVNKYYDMEEEEA